MLIALVCFFDSLGFVASELLLTWMVGEYMGYRLVLELILRHACSPLMLRRCYKCLPGETRLWVSKRASLGPHNAEKMLTKVSP